MFGSANVSRTTLGTTMPPQELMRVVDAQGDDRAAVKVMAIGESWHVPERAETQE